MRITRAGVTANVCQFSHKALGEMTVIGKEITKELYSTSDKIYTYFSGCSDGGRQGMSQVQNWGSVYDGVAAGAPAFRQSHQQIVSQCLQKGPQGYVLIIAYYLSFTFTLLSSR